jgi:hypothetical protein
MADSHWKGMCLARRREAAGDGLPGDEQIIRPDETVTIETAQSVGAIWLNRCTMPGRWRSTPMQVSVSSKWVMAAYRFLTGGN